MQVTWLTKRSGYFSPLADKVKEASFLSSKWWLFYSVLSSQGPGWRGRGERCRGSCLMGHPALNPDGQSGVQKELAGLGGL